MIYFQRKIGSSLVFPPVLVASYAGAWGFALRGWFGQFSTHLAGDSGGDGSLTAWQLLWPYEWLVHRSSGRPGDLDFATYINGDMFAGLAGGGAYAFSDMMPGWLPLVALLRLFTSNSILIVNCIHLASLLALPLGVYFFARSWRLGRMEAWWAGILATFTAYQFDMLLHLQMQFLFAPVFALGCQVRARAGGKLFLRHVAGWWLALAWTLLVSPHLFLYGVIASGLLLLIGPRPAFDSLPIRTNRFWLFLLAVAVCLVLAMGAAPYWIVGERYGFKRLMAEAYFGGLRLEHFAYDPLDRGGGPHERNARLSPLLVGLFFWAVLRQSRVPGDRRRAPFIAGTIALLFWISAWKSRFGWGAVLAADLLIIGALVFPGRSLYRFWRYPGRSRFHVKSGRPLAIGRLALLAGFFWLAAFGPLPVFHNLELPLANPYRLLYEFVPGFDRIRASSRIFVFFPVFFAIVAARGLGLFRTLLRLYHGSLRPLRLPFRSVGPVVCLLFVGWQYLDALPGHWRPAGDFTGWRALEELHRGLAARRVAEPIMIVDSTTRQPERLEAASLLLGLGNARTMMGGYSGVRVEPYVYLRSALLARTGWTRSQKRAVLERAGVGSLFVSGPEGFRPLILSRNQARESPPACPERLSGSWRLTDRMSSRQALVLGYRPTGPFCLNEYGRFRDRRLMVAWQSPEAVRSTGKVTEVRISSPYYYHPEAIELLYAAAGPTDRGEYMVILREGSHELHRQRVQVN